MLDWIYDVPAPILAVLVIGAFTGVGLGGLWVARRTAIPWLRIGPHDSEFVGALHHGILVIYGLAVALIAVAVWESYSEVSRVVSLEATAIASIYRDADGYPEPDRGRLQQALRDYTRQIIDEAWPIQRRGRIPARGVAMMDAFESELYSFIPATDAQRILHAETLRAYDNLIEARRLRLHGVEERLPTALWGVILLGAALGLMASYFFRVESARLHYAMVGLLAMLMGLVVFMIALYDCPYRGSNAVGPRAYEVVYEQLMSP